MRLTRFITVGAGAMIALSIAFSISVFLIAETTNSSVHEALTTGVTTLDTSRKLALTAADVRFDVVQVQQWLTDISATRGLDGLDDGYAEAESFAKKLTVDLETGRQLAHQLGRDDIIASFDGVAAAFGPYYDTGKTMAAAYVADGPAGGNALMIGFDAVAADISDAIAVMLADIDAMVADELAEVAARKDSAESLAALNTNVTRTGNIIIILAIVFMAWFTRRQFGILNKVADTAREIAGGNYDAHRWARRSGMKWRDCSQRLACSATMDWPWWRWAGKARPNTRTNLPSSRCALNCKPRWRAWSVPRRRVIFRPVSTDITTVPTLTPWSVTSTG